MTAVRPACATGEGARMDGSTERGSSEPPAGVTKICGSEDPRSVCLVPRGSRRPSATTASPASCCTIAGSTLRARPSVAELLVLRRAGAGRRDAGVLPPSLTATAGCARSPKPMDRKLSDHHTGVSEATSLPQSCSSSCGRYWTCCTSPARSIYIIASTSWLSLAWGDGLAKLSGRRRHAADQRALEP